MISWGMPSLAEFDSMEENAALCRRLGLRFIEANMNLPCFQPERLEYAVRTAAAYGVGVTLHADENFAPADFNSLLANAHIETFRRTLRLARRLDIEKVNMHLNKGVYFSLPEGKLYLHGKYRSAWMERMRVLRSMCDAELGGSGVRVCVENTDGWVDHQIEALRFLLESDVFCLTWDIGHSSTSDSGDESILDSYSHRILHYHIHDALGRRCHLPLGAGKLDLSEYLKKAQRCGASCVLETKSPEGIALSVEWLNRNSWI